MDKHTQLMVITMEECGELVQACSKILRRGHKKDEENLLDEAGDVLCMLKLLEEFEYFDWKDLEDRVKYKRKKLKKWSEIL